MPRSLQRRRVARKSIKLAQVRPRRSIAKRSLAASGRRDHPSHRLIGLPLATTIPNIKNIRWHYCTRTDEQLAAQLGKSLLRLGICNARDWSGSALDLVERGFKRFCRANGADHAKRIWEGNLRITDCQFDSDESYRDPFDREPARESEVLYLVGDFNSAASVPIGPTLSKLGREHQWLPKAFFEVLTENLYKWMRVYDYRDAVEQANCYMEGADVEDLKDSFYPLVEKKIPECLRIPANPNCEHASRLLADIQHRLQTPIARHLVSELLTMDSIGKGHDHPWPGKLVAQVPGLEEYLSDADGCCPGCAITWHEDDEISACFDEEANTMGQNGPLEPSIMLMIRLNLPMSQRDEEVRRVFDYVGAMLRSLASGAKIVELIREVCDEYLRDDRLKSGVQVEPSPAGVRQE